MRECVFMSSFKLHTKLQQESIEVGRFALCELRLMNDNQFPWFILIPQLPEMSEIFQLEPAAQIQLQQESCLLLERLYSLYQADKINVATLGNEIPQLHVHHIVRYRYDKAWPVTVWGWYAPLPYSAGLNCNASEPVCRMFY